MTKPVAGVGFGIFAMMSVCRWFARRVKLGEIAAEDFLQSATRWCAMASGRRSSLPA